MAEIIGLNSHTLTSAGFKKLTFQDYRVYYLDNPSSNTIDQAASAVLKKNQNGNTIQFKAALTKKKCLVINKKKGIFEFASTIQETSQIIRLTFIQELLKDIEDAIKFKGIANVKVVYDQFVKSLPAIKEAQGSELYEEAIEGVTKLFRLTYIESLMNNLLAEQEQSTLENKKLIYYELAKAFSFLEETQKASSFYNEYIQVAKEQNSLLVDHFVGYSMILEEGIYTLFGKKAVSEINIDSNPPSAQEFINMHNDSSSEKHSTAYREVFTLDSLWHIPLENQWEAFKNMLTGFKLGAHFFLENRYADPDNAFNSILFVHEPSLIKVLSQHHKAFEQGTEEGFSPQKKVADLKMGRPSKFWEAIFNESNPYLAGLVFGFGEQNSRCFQMEIQDELDPTFKKSDCNQEIEIQDTYSIEDLSIPSFASYSLSGSQDPVLEAYEKYQNAIIKHLKDKNLREEVFKILKNGSPI